MREETREKRRAEIMAAAYAVLLEKGYRATSMLAVAKRAKASNETLYAWFGGKQGLFEAMVTENAHRAAGILQAALADARDLRETLGVVGPELLRLVTGERAVALNRAAAADADETGTLGPTIARHGREAVAPLLAQMFERARARGQMAFDDTQTVVETYIALLIGDLQVRRVIGAIDTPGAAWIETRAARAATQLLSLYGGEDRP